MAETGMTVKGEQALATFADAQIFAKAAYESGLFTDVKSEAQAIVKIIAGNELGITPLMSMNKLYIVNGKIGMAGEIATVLLQQREYKIEGKFDNEDNPTACEITLSRPDKNPPSFTWRFTKADAIKAKLLKADGAHEKFPKDMWWNRALMGAARKYAPEALGGMGYTPEELKGIIVDPDGVPDTTARDVTPATISKTASPDLVDAAKGMGAVELDYTLSKDFTDRFGDIVAGCNEHKCDWEMSQYGKQHQADNSFCKQRDAIRNAAKIIVKQALNIDAFDLKDGKNYVSAGFKAWVAKNANDAIWGKLDDKQQCELLDLLMHSK